jgi:hypothetical protein
MKAWLYLEAGTPIFDGPYYAFNDLRSSPLWELEGACIWLEKRVGQSVAYKNLLWTGLDWVATSQRLYPHEPFRPTVLIEGRPCVLSGDR